MTKEEAIFTLSDIRSEYNCFSHIEGGRYHALSMGIEALKERKHGKWISEIGINEKYGVSANIVHCSECNLIGYWEPNFCPKCGARMVTEDV